MSSNENDDPAQIGMRIRGANGQTADLLTVEQYDGTDVFTVDKDGVMGGTYTRPLDPDIASYIVWKSGSTYYAKNGADGSVTMGSAYAALLNGLITSLAAAGGGEIYTRPGAYTVETPIIGASNIKLTASEGTILTVSGETNCFSATSCSNLRIIGFEIDGSKDTKSEVKNAILLSACADCIVSDNEVVDWFGDSIWVQVCSNISIRDNIVATPDTTVNRSAITVWNCTDCTIQDNEVVDAIVANGNGGVCSNIRIIGNTLTGHALSHGGIYAYRGARDILISQNYATSFEHSGVEARGENVTVTDNILTGNATGIEVSGSLADDMPKGILIQGNLLFSNTYDGISIYDSGNVAPSDVLIKDNLIVENGRYGIMLADPGLAHTDCTDIVIEGNYFCGNGAVPLWTVADEVVIDNNIFVENLSTEVVRVGGVHVGVSNNFISGSTPETVYAIRASNTASDVQISGNTIRNLVGGIGVYLTSTTNFSVVGNYIDSVGYGINCATATDGVISGNNITLCTGLGGIYMTAGSEVAVNDNFVSNNDIEGIYLSGCTYCSVVGNVANHNERSETGSHAGLRLTDCSYMTVMGNTMIDTGGPALQTYGVYITGTNDYFSIVGNVVKPNMGAGIYGSTGANTIIKENIGFVTEKDGSAIISSGDTYVDVTHGLGVTPTIQDICVTPQDNLQGRLFWLSDVGASTFRINVDALDFIDHTFGWGVF